MDQVVGDVDILERAPHGRAVERISRHDLESKPRLDSLGPAGEAANLLATFE
jgi:hypothetical protein